MNPFDFKSSIKLLNAVTIVAASASPARASTLFNLLITASAPFSP